MRYIYLHYRYKLRYYNKILLNPFICEKMSTDELTYEIYLNYYYLSTGLRSRAAQLAKRDVQTSHTQRPRELVPKREPPGLLPLDT